MLARHLLFLATRRHHNTLLPIPSESVPPHAIVQPPPLYISPPKPESQQKDSKFQETLTVPVGHKTAQASSEKQKNYEQQRFHSHDIYIHDPRHNLYDNNPKFCQRSRGPSYEFQRASDRQLVHMHNARNQQYYLSTNHGNQQFYTMPTRRAQKDMEAPRSVTPDITRGLGRDSFNGMHMLGRHPQKSFAGQDMQPHRFASQIDLSKRNLQNLDASKLAQSQQQQPIVDVKNRLATPLNLAALGYRFFASSPVRDPVTKSPSADVLRHNSISPIGYSYGNGFKSSTPTAQNVPTVAERLALSANNNCTSPIPHLFGNNNQASSGRSTPTNPILSPTKSTMSNEELFAAIHKSKKRLNIKEDSENLSPYGSMNSLVKAPAGSRHSWSPEFQKPPEIIQHVQSPSATSRLDFKRLLLQQSVKTGPSRLSAAEQLKLSRQQCQQQCQQQSSGNIAQTPLTKVLSPRSVWRFQTPRTDVLSSTIIEDTAAEEKAMKPSPENTSPLSRLNARRNVDFSNDHPDQRRVTSFQNNVPNTVGNNAYTQSTGTSGKQCYINIDATRRNMQLQDTIADQSMKSNVQCLKEPTGQSTRGLLANQRISSSHGVSGSPNSGTQHSSNTTQLSPACQGAKSAFESRRISNQLAKAQFLANTPTSTNPGENAYFRKRFRARSESPQHNTTQQVARSPSAPTLETAL